MHINKQTITEIKNIDFVNKRDLCTECGTCFGVCPKDNILVQTDEIGQFRFKAKEPKKCILCSICYDVCPGFEVDFDRLNTEVFSAPVDLDLPFSVIGHFTNTYIGHATDDQTRSQAASGGITSALLCYALETGKIDGVYVVRMKNATEGNPLSPEVYLATTKEQILMGQQSKYITIPMNECLRDIWKHGKGRKYAFVGIPCQLHGLRKAEQCLPKLRGRIVLRIGLFCGHTMNRLGTQHLLRMVNTDQKEVEHIEYRAKQWPGNFLVQLKDGTQKLIEHSHWTTYTLTLYEKWRCHFCTDPFNQLADISVGDPWIKELHGQEGQNVVIARTIEGTKFLDKAVYDSVIELSYLPTGKIIESGKRMIHRKKHLILAYMRIAAWIGRAVPEYSGFKKDQKLSFHDYYETICLELIRSIAARKRCQTLMLWFGRLYLYLTKIAKSA